MILDRLLVPICGMLLTTQASALHPLVNPSVHPFNSSALGVEDVEEQPRFWDDFVTAGIDLYRDWENRSPDTPDRGIATRVDTHMRVMFDPQYPMEEDAREIITDRLGRSADAADWRVTQVEARSPNAPANYVCDVSASQGMIVVQDDYRGNPPARYSFASIAWWMWVQEVNRQDPDALSASELDYSGLEVYLVQYITDERTRLLVLWILRNKHLGYWPFVPDDVNDPNKANPFWALIGSPPGQNLIRMLTEHKGALKGKKIRRLVLRWTYGPPNPRVLLHSSGDVYALYAELEPNPAYEAATNC